MNIVILAAGPPKPNRQRHLEIYNGNPLILNIIKSCNFPNTKLFVVVNRNNTKLKEYLESLEYKFDILYPETEKIIDTLRTALSPSGDCILVCGDLVNLEKSDIEKFISTKYSSVLCRYKNPWGKNLHGKNNLIRRSDMGDPLMKISEKHKEQYLSSENIDSSIKYFKSFYPNKTINEYVFNDIGTHLDYSFFYEIWSNPKINEYQDKGTIFFTKNIYDDND